MDRRVFAALVGMALATAACSATSAPFRPATPSPTQVAAAPLVIAPAVAVPFIRDFNPFDPLSTASALGIRSLVYEPLYEIDALTPCSRACIRGSPPATRSRMAARSCASPSALGCG